ncbi:MAG: glycosyltransferase family 39 protein [Chloroflexi bacterium]|nr:glycosyltransferase family 39 protein [Chloroflexota bacterium]MCI0575030.1 glycosyltransferase family 39 protein [Chloroflexota bacterium]MCI0645742.1 glycosyltransferase family 39 protein [Chloroflexota bacterium]MCI0727669.1 glycosyltransferase family 39 protein [Chloroflexota bacterium]
MRTNRRLLVIIVLAVVLRLGAALYLGNDVTPLPGTFDQVSYHALALRLLGGHGFSFDRPWWPATAAGTPTAHWSFLYTFYLAAVYSLFGPQAVAARLLQAVIVGILHPYLAYRLGSAVFNDRVGLAAAGVTAIYAYFVYYTATLMTEPFYITAILASLYLTLRLARPEQTGEGRLALALGLALGSAVLLRQLYLLVIPFLLLWLWWARFRRGGKMPLAATAIVPAIVLAAILPFTLYNYARFDRFVLLNTNAGYAFYWANHPIYGTHFISILPPEMGSYRDLIPAELRRLHLDEAALDQELLRRGLRFVLDDPGRYVLLSFSRIPAYFTFWPSAGSELLSNVARVASFGLFLPVMLYGLGRSFHQRRDSPYWLDPASLLVLFTVLYTVIHLLSWALIRYRLPVDAILVIFAGSAVVDVLARLRPGRPVRRGALVSQD